MAGRVAERLAIGEYLAVRLAGWQYGWQRVASASGWQRLAGMWEREAGWQGLGAAQLAVSCRGAAASTRCEKGCEAYVQERG